METCRLSTVLLLAYIGLSSVVLEAQVRVKPQVTGYLGDEVTLHCELLQGNLTQAEWQWERLDGKKIFIAVFSPKFGQNISGSPLKERLKFTGASTGDPSITIKDVAMTDAGNYTCSLTAFPSGSIAKTTILTVLDQTPPSSGEVAWIVTAAVVLTVVVTATAYLIIVRKRREALFNPSVNIDVSSLVVNADRRGREEDMVYSEIVRFNIVKSKAHNPCGGDQKDADVKPAENATYSAVAVGNQHPFGEETVYSQVVRKDWDIDDVWTV